MTDPAQLCPITNLPATVTPENPGSHNYLVLSPSAGGTYYITRTAISGLGSLKSEERRALVEYIVTRTLAGIDASLDGDSIKKLKSTPVPWLGARAERLLRHFEKLCAYEGVHRKLEAVESSFAWAVAGALNDAEFNYVLKFLEDEGLLELKFEASGKFQRFQIRPDGYRRLHELRVNTTSMQAFIAMWFHVSMDDAFQLGIEPAVRNAGWMPLRIDQKEHSNKIDDEIVGEIRRSRFVVADFTCEPEKARGGVYFEAGLAQGLGLPVIWTCRADRLAQVHFDTRQYNHIAWGNPEDLRAPLLKRILAVVGEGPLKA